MKKQIDWSNDKVARTNLNLNGDFYIDKYTPVQVFDNHHPEYELTLKEGEKFTIQGLKVWQKANPKIKFTLSENEKISLMFNSCSEPTIRAVKTKGRGITVCLS
jgi:hypothetical protein